MATRRPFDISELRQYVARFLDVESLRACALVNKSWHDDFQPMVWRTYWIIARRLSDNNSPSNTHGKDGKDGTDSKDLKTWVAVTGKHAHLFRCLRRREYRDECPVPRAIYDTLLEHCHSLVQIDAWVKNLDEWAMLRELVRVNPGLQRVTLRYRKDSLYDEGLSTVFLPANDWKSYGRKEIYIEGAVITAPTYPPQRLGDEGNSDNNNNNNSNNNNNGDNSSSRLDHNDKAAAGLAMLSSRLCKLAISGRCHDASLIELLEQCPSLTRLEVPLLSEPVYERLCQAFETGRLSQVIKVSLRESSRTWPSLATLHVLRAIPQHQLRKVRLRNMGLREIQVLVERQHQSLESVVVQGAPQETPMALLASCPRLKTLYVSGTGFIDVRHLLAQPWVCAPRLEKLEVNIRLERPCKDSVLMDHASAEKALVAPGRTEAEQTEIMWMTRLGQCRLLREAVISMPCSPKSEQLSWSLASGLNRLCELSHLEMLAFGDWVTLGVPELRFIKDHWHSLKSLPQLDVRPHASRQWLQENWRHLHVPWHR
ncbi:hypothetical protein DFQ27_002701 [Actinomortierella ambigua]|uniref:F-box domain-containing protein n=1 Tax=Actinomortierella ambigua TaxID=1343610 RepID=A0A9P6QAV3_9FUNG|nr:hypothetical protein DFQ27_002701 [Actinomortierella ambigua]